MKILITGSTGQLGSEIIALNSVYPGLELVCPNSKELDICNQALLNDFVKDQGFMGIINCAGYTAVDKAEQNAGIAGLVNAKAVGHLVAVSQRYQLKLIHISTDYVFDGTSNRPYTERMPVCPLGAYGKTKRAGEMEIMHSPANAIIVRTSWLYSSFGNNFVKTMLRLGEEKDSLSVVYDQIGTPTYARDLAQVCLDIISQPGRIDTKGKLYHYSNEGVTSWYDFAQAIMEMADIDCKLNPIESKDYPTAAKRPAYSVLNKAKIKADFGIEIPHWRNSLKACLSVIKNI
ncbi:dTDP-4-dehydrorhamnose reductase [Ancylomarina sp. YFZ004]